MKKLSVIVSVYNEEAGLEKSCAEMTRVLTGLVKERPELSYELLYVNDGSKDASGRILESLRESDPEHIGVIPFSRNFGHEAAMTAGLDYADGDYLVFLDADLQHPPACIPEILKKFDEGYEIVSMVRTANETAGAWKKVTSALFYRLINRLSSAELEPNASDFFAMNRQAADVLRNSYREKVRFLRGFVQNIGFRKTTLEYEAASRVAGQSHYNFGRLLKLSMDTIVCFSDLPLKAGIYAGIFSGFLGFVLIIYTLLTRRGAPSGYATIVIVMCFMFSVLFLVLGILGKYIAVMFEELKRRPIYIAANVQKAGEERPKTQARQHFGTEEEA